MSVSRLIGESGISKADFQTLAGLNRKFGFGVEDHNRALAFMLSQGIVKEEGGRYFRGALELYPWIAQGIYSGDPHLADLSMLPGFTGQKKFQNDLATEIGLKGELFVMSLLKEMVDPDQVNRIDHVSLYDDAAGYDIRTPSVTGAWEEVLLEVKTTTRGEGREAFFLTRNEMKVAETEPNWYLIFVKLTSSGPKLLGHLVARELEPLLPKDQTEGLVWSEVTGRIPTDELRLGLP